MLAENEKALIKLLTINQRTAQRPRKSAQQDPILACLWQRVKQLALGAERE
ncbi:hypothetical protein [Pseudomonas sp. MGal98]|uniref:hypothetical protein n=1 Tax=Pseudomonas sp. MGal98 TaxID=3162460 RepID=UPI0032EF54EE